MSAGAVPERERETGGGLDGSYARSGPASPLDTQAEPDFGLDFSVVFEAVGRQGV